MTYYVLFLQLHPFSRLRYVLPVYLLGTWPAGRLAADLLRLQAPRAARAITAAVLGVVLGFSLLHGLSLLVLYRFDARYAAEQWMERTIPPNARILAVAPDYSLPRFSRQWAVRRRAIWRDGRQVAEPTETAPDYVVLSMSVPDRQHHRARVEAFFRNRGFRKMVEFTSPLPVFLLPVPELHTVLPDIVVLERAPAAGEDAAAGPRGRAVAS